MSGPWEKYGAVDGPWAKYQNNSAIAAEAAPSDVTQAESFGRGLLQGGTLNFADEIGGGLFALGDAAKKWSLSDLVSDYVKNRDEIRANNDAAQKANPWTYGAGQLGGGIATTFVPGLNLAKGATLAKAAALGGANALGASNADLTKGEFGQAAVDTAVGAGLGGGSALVAGQAAPLANKLGIGFQKASDKLLQNANNPASSVLKPSDLFSTGAGFIMGDPTGGVATTIAKRMAEPYLNKAGAYGASAAGNFLQNSSPMLQAATPALQRTAVATTGLLNQSEPLESQQDAPPAELEINRITEKLQADPKAQRFVGPLQKAAAKGQEALSSTYFILQQSEPDFQRVMRGEN